MNNENNIIIGLNNCNDIVTCTDNIVIGRNNTSNDYAGCVIIGKDLKATADNHVFLDFHIDLNNRVETEAVSLIIKGIKMLVEEKNKMLIEDKNV